MDYKIQIFNKMPNLLDGKVKKLRERCFNRDFMSPSQKAENEDKYCSQADRYKYIVALKAYEPISLVMLFKRNVIFDNKKILLGGIGGVCTEESYREKGISSSLLKIAIQELKKENCDVAYLCTNIKTYGNFYSKIGFKQLPKQHTYLGKSGKRYFDWDGMIAPMNSQAIFKEIMESDKNLDIGTGNW